MKTILAILASLAVSSVAGNSFAKGNASDPAKWSLVVRHNGINHDIRLFPALRNAPDDDDYVTFDVRLSGFSCEYGVFSNALVVNCHTTDGETWKRIVLRSGEEKAYTTIRLSSVSPNGKETFSLIGLQFDPDAD